ncbi:MAG: DUF1987 domain-containing protein [Bacteroidota bacterium]
MKLLSIQPTKFTPKVEYDPGKKTLEFNGFSLPENVYEFYGPVIKWLKEYFKDIDKEDLKDHPIIVKFKLSYFNSGSLKCIIEIIFQLADWRKNGIPVEIYWHYDEADTQIKESGQDISEIVGKSFFFVKN